MFRFTIRELVLVTVIVAVGLGWWVRESAWILNSKRLRRRRGGQPRHWEATLTEDGWTVEWGHPSNQVQLIKSPEKSMHVGASFVHMTRNVTTDEPSSKEP